MPPRIDSFIIRAEQVGEDRLSWVQLMYPVSEFRNGPWFLTVTEDDLAAYAESIRANASRLPVDRDHRIEKAEQADSRAAGWFTGAAKVLAKGDTRPDGSDEAAASAELWAEIEWTPRALQEIRDGEYRFMSPVHSFHERNTKTGLLTKAKEILNATLTNQPAFARLAAVLAEVVWAPGEGYQRLSERLYAELNPGGPEHARYWVMDVAPGKALVREYDSDTTWVVPYAVDGDEIQVADRNDWTAAEQEWVEAAQASIQRNGAARPFNPKKENTMDMKVLAASLGLPEDATEEQIVEAAKTAHASVTKVTELETENATLKAAAEDTGGDVDEQATKIADLEMKLADQQSERTAEKVDAALDKAVAERRIVPAEKPVLAEQFAGNLDGLAKTLAVRPQVRGEVGHGGSGAPDDPDAPVTAETRRRFASTEADGIDEESLTVHARAEKILAKTDYTEAEYIAACEQAERELVAA